MCVCVLTVSCVCVDRQLCVLTEVRCVCVCVLTGSCAGQFRAAGGQCFYTSLLDDPAERVSWADAGNSCVAQSPLDGVTPVLASFTTADQLVSGL